MTAYLNISVCPALSNVSLLLSVRMAVKNSYGVSLWNAPLKPFRFKIHIAPFSPKVIVHRVHGSQSGNNFGLSVWGNPPLHHLPYGILCLLSHLVCCSYHKVAQHLIAFSGRNDFIICAVPENSLSGIKYFKFLSAMGTATATYSFRKSVSAFPAVSTFRTSDSSAFCAVGMMLEAMFKSVCFLLVCQFGQSA